MNDDQDSFRTDDDFIDLDQELLGNQSIPMLQTLKEKKVVENVIDIDMGRTT